MNVWHNPRLLNFVASTMTAIAVLTLIVAAIAWVSHRPYFELRSVQIAVAPSASTANSIDSDQPFSHVAAGPLIKKIKAAYTGNFFTIDMMALKKHVETVPWIRQATVRRIWPDQLVIHIEEHVPFALWEDGRLINSFGEMFTASLDEAERDGPLPQLGGPAGMNRRVITRFNELAEIVARINLQPVSVHLSARHAWTVKLDDGTELLIGREQDVAIADRIARWVESYALVTERIQRRATVIDLRYPNGYAVRSLEPLTESFSIDDLIADATQREVDSSINLRRNASDQSQAAMVAQRNASKRKETSK